MTVSSLPVPPSIVSSPVPPSIVSPLPFWPLRTSLPAPPSIVSAAAAAVDRVRAVVAREGVGLARAGQVLDVQVRVGAAVAVGRSRLAGRDARGDARRCRRVVGRVRAGAAVEGVVPAAPGERVVPVAAVQGVVVRVTAERVGERRAGQVLEAVRDDGVGAVAGVLRGWVPEVDRHRPRRGRVREGVVPRAAVERRVVTAAAVDRVRPGVAGDAVAEVGADHVLEPAERV